MLNAIKKSLLRIPQVQNFVFERADRRLIEAGDYAPQLSPTHILDLGAHKGYASTWFQRMFPEAIIHAYEPNPYLLSKLKRNTKDLSTVRVFTEAIAEHPGSIEFYVSPNNLSSSVIKTKGKVITVPAITLREAAHRLGGKRIFVKIDVEGAEYDSLRDIPDSIVEIVGEMHPKKANKNMEEIRNLLSDFSNIEINTAKRIFRATR